MADKKEPVATGHRLRITVVEAKGLRPTNYFSKTTDAFVEISHMSTKGNSQPQRSQVMFGSCSPKWDECITLDLSETPHFDFLVLLVWGRHIVGSNAFIGRLEIPVSFVIESDMVEKLKSNDYREGAVIERWFHLLPQRGYNLKYQTGDIKLRFQYVFVPLVHTHQKGPATPAQHSETKQKVDTSKNPILYYQCPKCKQLFMPDAITQHLNTCSPMAVLAESSTHQSELLPTRPAPPIPVNPSVNGVISVPGGSATGIPQTITIPPPPQGYDDYSANYYGNAPSAPVETGENYDVSYDLGNDFSNYYHNNDNNASNNNMGYYPPNSNVYQSPSNSYVVSDDSINPPKYLYPNANDQR